MKTETYKRELYHKTLQDSDVCSFCITLKKRVLSKQAIESLLNLCPQTYSFNVLFWSNTNQKDSSFAAKLTVNGAIEFCKLNKCEIFESWKSSDKF
jgi:hypothetical protein